MMNWGCVVLSTMMLASSAMAESVDAERSIVYGPGLRSNFFLAVRYFFIQAVSADGNNYTHSVGESPFEVAVLQGTGQRARARVDVLDTDTGVYIARFRLVTSYDGLTIHVRLAGNHVAKSPYELEGMVYHEDCRCPQPDLERWYHSLGCLLHFRQIKEDLAPFSKKDNPERIATEVIDRFVDKKRRSIIRYKIIDNKIYRKTYGTLCDFKTFSDEMLISLTRKVRLPDVEFFVNPGDWPLVDRDTTRRPLPVFSWCGSDDTHDIVLPTYKITTSTLHMLGRVSLDVFSARKTPQWPWGNKTEKGFWRGRDSRQERLDLVLMSRKYPGEIDAALTNMFFFPKDEEKYGELVKPIPFFDFFKFKYQINIDGTVAAYRLPYLMAGDAVVFKQDSSYYEHFYKDMKPFQHYIPFKRGLSDLMEKIQWAKDNDDKAKGMRDKARTLVMDHLQPHHIYCYHAKVLEEFSRRMEEPLPPHDSWELVEGSPEYCNCKQTSEAVKERINKVCLEIVVG